MESAPYPNPVQGQHLPPVAGVMSAETDALFRRWLKLQIASMYWGMIFKVIMFVLIAGSIVFSTITLGPIVQQQLEVLTNLQRTMGGLSGSRQPEAPALDISEIIKQLVPQQPSETPEEKTPKR